MGVMRLEIALYTARASAELTAALIRLKGKNRDAHVDDGLKRNAHAMRGEVLAGV